MSKLCVLTRGQLVQPLVITPHISSPPDPVDHIIRVAAMDAHRRCHGDLWLRPGPHLLARCPGRHQSNSGGHSGDHRGVTHSAGHRL